MDQEALKAVRNRKQILTFYEGPVYPDDSTVIDVDDAVIDNPSLKPHPKNSDLVNAVDLSINFAVDKLNMERTDRIAVLCDVSGMDKPVFYVKMGSKRYLCYEIDDSSNKAFHSLIPHDLAIEAN